ncbi:class I SAM-dependent methyltransferase, partial [Arthrospira platensis SPKY1]|nr:class I SAM-dependent methyltransferase [Arthrospira platensis SPKY1]
FQNTLEGVLKLAQPIDFLFNDGHHDRQAVLNYLEQSLPYLASPAVVVFDDISWSPGMRQAWEQIEQHPNALFTLDLDMIGLAVFSRKVPHRQNLRIPL